MTLHSSVSGDRLRAINRELSTMLQKPPASLSFGAEAASEDQLVVCGLLGGKDVGKSTLINALATTEVSPKSAQVSEGTSRPMAYVHEQMQSVVALRLREIDRHVPVEVTTHQVDALHNTVLVDLPDFDSEFPEHLRIVQSVVPLLDRVLWVLTPRKIGDRAWVDMFRSVIKDTSNVFTVLNKVDELLSDGDSLSGSEGKNADELAGRFWSSQQEWVGSAIIASGCSQQDDHRFLVSAGFDDADSFVAHVASLWDDPNWSSYADDKPVVQAIGKLAAEELSHLRECVLSPVSEAEARDIKGANAQRELQVASDRIDNYYELDDLCEALEDTIRPEYLQMVFEDSFGSSYCQTVGSALHAGRTPDTALADELLGRRVQDWPLLRLVYWPFGWLSRLVGRRLGSASQDSITSEVLSLNVDGRSTADRVRSMRDRLLTDQASLDRIVDLSTKLPDINAIASSSDSEMRNLNPVLERRLLDACSERCLRPTFLRKAFLLLVLVWFPFLQPIAEGSLEILSVGGTFETVHGLYKIVSAFSAAKLLTGFAVVLVVYLAVIAGMYAAALRAVREGSKSIIDPLSWPAGVEETLLCEVVTPLISPFQDLHRQLEQIRSELRAVD